MRLPKYYRGTAAKITQIFVFCWAKVQAQPGWYCQVQPFNINTTGYFWYNIHNDGHTKSPIEVMDPMLTHIKVSNEHYYA